jgi:hypothetical protein
MMAPDVKRYQLRGFVPKIVRFTRRYAPLGTIQFASAMKTSAELVPIASK